MAGVLCSGCGTLNTSATKFCIECGTSMSAHPITWDRALTLDFLADLPISRRMQTALTFTAVFLFAFLVYYFASQVLNGQKPLNWLNFYVYLADAITKGTSDLREAGLTGTPHPDLAVRDGAIFLPYGPTPALLLLPSILLVGAENTTQWLHSMIVGAVNVSLVWYILRLLRTSRTTQFLMVPFFAFGTANFYSATTGTVWFFNHVVAVMFILLAIVFLLRGSPPYLSAICLGLAMLARQPAVLAVPFFVYVWIRQQHPTVFDLQWLRDKATRDKILVFGATLMPFVLFYFWYNAVRFGGIFETGLDDLYDKYEGQVLTIYLRDFDITDRFAMFDIRNIPLHLYTIFLLPPTFAPPLGVSTEAWGNATWIRPSEYGMSVLLTSSPFAYALLVRRHEALRNACWITIPLVAIPTLLYFSQGWVQFGYRYLMDYLPFLMILTALGVEENQSSRTSFRIAVVLVVISVVIGFWGRYWGTRLGW
jgi:hypothetical protein